MARGRPRHSSNFLVSCSCTPLSRVLGIDLDPGSESAPTDRGVRRVTRLVQRDRVAETPTKTSRALGKEVSEGNSPELVTGSAVAVSGVEVRIVVEIVGGMLVEMAVGVGMVVDPGPGMKHPRWPSCSLQTSSGPQEKSLQFICPLPRHSHRCVQSSVTTTWPSCGGETGRGYKARRLLMGTWATRCHPQPACTWDSRTHAVVSTVPHTAALCLRHAVPSAEHKPGVTHAALHARLAAVLGGQAVHTRGRAGGGAGLVVGIERARGSCRRERREEGLRPRLPPLETCPSADRHCRGAPPVCGIRGDASRC